MLFKCTNFCFSAFWPGCHDLLYSPVYFVSCLCLLARLPWHTEPAPWVILSVTPSCGGATSPSVPLFWFRFPLQASLYNAGEPTLSYFPAHVCSAMLYFLQGAPCPHLTSFLASFIVLFSASHCCSKDSSAVNCVRCPPQDQFPRVAPLMPLCLPCLSLSIDLPPIVVPVAASQVATPQAQFPRRAPVTAALKTTFTFPRENSSHSIDTTLTLTGDKTD